MPICVAWYNCRALRAPGDLIRSDGWNSYSMMCSRPLDSLGKMTRAYACVKPVEQQPAYTAKTSMIGDADCLNALDAEQGATAK